ncbi:hypothetical protein D3C73_1596540 [compost metagenome]
MEQIIEVLQTDPANLGPGRQIVDIPVREGEAETDQCRQDEEDGVDHPGGQQEAVGVELKFALAHGAQNPG